MSTAIDGIQAVGSPTLIAPEATARALAYAPTDEVGPLHETIPLEPRGGTSTASFGSMLAGQLRQLDGVLQTAQDQSLRLASGQAASLHEVMLNLEHARLQFQLALQVRNRVMEALQDLQRMQL